MTSSPKKPDVVFILEKVGPGRSEADFALFACRGAGRGCKRNLHRKNLKHCADCLAADNPEETIGDFKARLERGDS
jgi:hypothetical protein